MADAKEPKVLVLYFSRSGTTRQLAEAIARATNADIEELREERSRHGLWGWLRSGYDGTYRRSATTLPLRHDVLGYDLVFIGSPTWNKALSSPVRGFLEQQRDRLPAVALFATCQGDGAQMVIEQMKELLPNPPVATLTMLERDVKHCPAVSVGELVEAALCRLEQVQQASSS